MNVSAIRESQWEKDGQQVTTYWVAFDSGKEVPCYDAAASSLVVDQPLPEGWEIRQSKAGKDYLAPPKKKGGGFGGGAPAHRNTKEGQAFEQQQMNRRTALMQAVEVVTRREPRYDAQECMSVADDFYAWLQSSAGGEKGSPPAAPQSEGVGSETFGEGATGSASSDSSHDKPEPHRADMNPIRPGSSLFRCAFPGCPVTTKVGA